MGEFDLFPTPRSNEEIVEAEGLPRISTGRTVSSRPPSSRRSIGS
jgi:hypothetical protein